MANMTERREVNVSIGKRTYLIQTELDDETLGRVEDIVKEACESLSGNIDQSSLLMLTCLHLAYNIEKMSHLLDSLDRRLNDLTPRCMQIEKECN